jgi:hypothetical protein
MLGLGGIHPTFPSPRRGRATGMVLVRDVLWPLLRARAGNALTVVPRCPASDLSQPTGERASGGRNDGDRPVGVEHDLVAGTAEV